MIGGIELRLVGENDEISLVRNNRYKGNVFSSFSYCVKYVQGVSSLNVKTSTDKVKEKNILEKIAEKEQKTLLSVLLSTLSFILSINIIYRHLFNSLLTTQLFDVKFHPLISDSKLIQRPIVY